MRLPLPPFPVPRANIEHAVFCTTFAITRHVVAQHKHGNRHVWRTALVRFNPHQSMDFGHSRSPSVFGGRADYLDRTNAAAFNPGINLKW